MSADELRNAMVERIAVRHQALGLVLPPEIERALRTVPRHLFTGDVPLEDAYGDGSIITVRGEDGLHLSSVSAAWLQAMMLGQAALKPGDRVLEVGSGGYNAALIRELVGPTGSVTTVDIDETVTDRARRCLAEAGYGDVEVMCADAEFEIDPGRRTFDVIIVTVGVPDISPALWTQLADNGRLVIPLRTLGLTRSWVLHRDGPALVSSGHLMCGFVPLRGAGARPGLSIPLREDPSANLWLGEGRGIDGAGELTGVLDLPRVQARSGVTIGEAQPSDDQDVWLAATVPGFCLLVADQTAIDTDVVRLSWPYGSPACVNRNTLAYRGMPVPVDGRDGVREFVTYAHGPDAEQVAAFLAGQITAWDAAGRPAPCLRVYPAGTSDADLPDGYVLDKRHSRLVISWPTAR
ncbi:methyltransferase, FxLD system [Microbispora sp. H10670]|uniref:methyltransferase, FxLD system n=1 Tax=Microbispora sp. H10670 TaxID=2729108 RepID=UPI0015FFCBF9|nr:methyltransferase, FxLD system [Microbispora sp. H10670]